MSENDHEEVIVQEIEAEAEREEMSPAAPNADEGLDEDEEESEDLDSASRQHQNDDSVLDEDESVMEIDERTENTGNDEGEEDEITVKSEIVDDDGSVASKSKDASVASTLSKTKTTPVKGGSSIKKGVRDLTIPFRTVKKAMKLDPDIPIVQNEAAIMATIATEAFLRSLAKKSYLNAKSRSRNTIRYEDVAEARSQHPNLSFLEPLLP